MAEVLVLYTVSLNKISSSLKYTVNLNSINSRLRYTVNLCTSTLQYKDEVHCNSDRAPNSSLRCIVNPTSTNLRLRYTVNLNSINSKLWYTVTPYEH